MIDILERGPEADSSSSSSISGQATEQGRIENIEIVLEKSALLVDDEAFNLMALEYMLTEKGFTRFAKAFNGQ